jgi:hypothetical protein
VQRFRRAFHWGALVIMDASSTDAPTQPAESGVATTDAGLMVPVRHAQDVDYEGLGLGPEEAVPPFEVEVEVRTGPPNGPISAEHTVRITSGALTIGDADDEIRAARLITGSSARMVPARVARCPRPGPGESPAFLVARGRCPDTAPGARWWCAEGESEDR